MTAIVEELSESDSSQRIDLGKVMGDDDMALQVEEVNDAVL